MNKKRSILEPNQKFQKFLISSPARFVGEYKSKDILISHAWPQPFDEVGQKIGLIENPYSRNFFVVVINAGPVKQEYKGLKILPSFQYLGEHFCVLLSILFGKRFDFHGFLEEVGFFKVPSFSSNSPIAFIQIGPNNHNPRKDLQIELKLNNFILFSTIFHKKYYNSKTMNYLLAAGNFYINAIRNFERNPELSFISLVSCGEVLSNYYKYRDDQIFDSEIINIFKKIESDFANGKSIIKSLKNRLYQIRKRYALTIIDLLNDCFFKNTESKNLNLSLKKDEIEYRILASYDLRSFFIHNGVNFGKYILPNNSNYEIQLGKPVVNSKKLCDLLFRSPTFVGLERIMRFCLLRFVHKNIFSVDERLN